MSCGWTAKETEPVHPDERNEIVRKDLSRILAVCAATLLAAPVSAQDDFSKVEIQTEKLADNVYMQVVASKPTAQYDEVWGKGFLAPEKFVAMLYGNIKK